MWMHKQTASKATSSLFSWWGAVWSGFTLLAFWTHYSVVKPHSSKASFQVSELFNFLLYPPLSSRIISCFLPSSVSRSSLIVLSPGSRCLPSIISFVPLFSDCTLFLSFLSDFAGDFFGELAAVDSPFRMVLWSDDLIVFGGFSFVVLSVKGVLSSVLFWYLSARISNGSVFVRMLSLRVGMWIWRLSENKFDVF